jgi:hypothetical protein
VINSFRFYIDKKCEQENEYKHECHPCEHTSVEVVSYTAPVLCCFLEFVVATGSKSYSKHTELCSILEQFYNMQS